MSEQDTRQDYFSTVATLASEASKADEPHDYIHETCDGSYWVIYTHAALKCLHYSDNWLAIDEYADDCGGFPEAVAGCNSLLDVLTRSAYHALVADVAEAWSELESDDDA